MDKKLLPEHAFAFYARQFQVELVQPLQKLNLYGIDPLVCPTVLFGQVVESSIGLRPRLLKRAEA